MKWFRRGLGTLLGLLVLAAAGLGWYAQRVLPQTSGEITLPGLGATLRIDRDANGVPTVHAANLRDLAYGLGVVHAQDRLWQLESNRRIGAGRLAEAFGESALPTDRFLRALGVHRAAEAQWATLGPEAREVLTAYAAGVNAVQHRLRARPPEFVILGLKTEDWTPVDSLAWAIMMAWDLGGNWSTELLRLRLAMTMPVERINQLLPPYPGETPMPTADYAALFRGLGLAGSGTLHAAARLPEIAPPSGVEGIGSNNWVLAGSHTASGHPLLANDPHLKLSAPALWYFVRLDAPGLKVAGATLPGLPLVVLGQNEHIAWGFTNTGPDVQDLYLEQIRPGDPGQYRTPDGWAPFETVRDVIKVKGRPDVPVVLRRTRHGPVISDAGIADDVLGIKPGKPGRPAYAIAMRWTALDPDADAVGVGLAFERAASVADFVSASRGWVAPMQNMVVADRDGHIGMVAPGRVPLRRPDNDLMGQVPSPGWEARYDWDGWVPADATPRAIDPPGGIIATANQRVTPPGYPYYLTSEWAAPYRWQRIEQVLHAKPRQSIADMEALQADVKSLAAPVILPWLLKAHSTHPLAAAAMQQLQGFDGTMAAGRAAPLIYWAWSRQLARAVFEDDVGSALWERSLATRSFLDALEGVLAHDDTSWCDDRRTPAVETCAMQDDAALTRALDELQARFGSDVSRWHWSDAHVARSEHRPFSHVKALAPFFELRTPVGGDTFTVNAGRVGLKPDPVTGELYLDEHGPSLRAIYDLGDPSQSRFMFSSGQSGIPFSPLYRRFVQPWTDVRYVPLWASGTPAETLVIKPQ
ncbi:MAG: penicillin amidase [Rubrivivax sp. SCN 70-15]|nr:MAG: penicillin amidase [Rubrivivax sp. SCN 70-15]